MVDELGEGATEFAVGDEVVGWAQGGSYAEYAIAGIVAKKPADLPWEQAVAPQGVDAVFDAAGKGALPDSIELRGGTDRIVTIADMSAGDLGVPLSAGGTAPEFTKSGLAEQLQLAAEGKLKLTVAKTFALADARMAHEVSEAGHNRGKLVIVP